VPWIHRCPFRSIMTSTVAVARTCSILIRPLPGERISGRVMPRGSGEESAWYAACYAGRPERVGCLSKMMVLGATVKLCLTVLSRLILPIPRTQPNQFGRATPLTRLEWTVYYEADE
jgi:hypothetical protein